MKIKMYDVEFGESILLLDGDNYEEKLLVDIGSDDSNFKFEPIWTDINGSTGKYKLMISHFHKDHISGLLDNNDAAKKGLIPKTEEIYIPNICDMKISEISYLELMFYYYFFKKILSSNSSVFTALKVLSYAISHKGKIVLLDKDKDFLFAGNKYSVLWPNLDADVFKDTSLDLSDIKEILSELEEEPGEIHSKIIQCVNKTDEILHVLSS